MDILKKISNVPLNLLTIREPLTFNKDNIKDISENGFTCNKIVSYNNIFNILEDEFTIESFGTLFVGIIHTEGLSSVKYILSNSTDVFEIDGYTDNSFGIGIWKLTDLPIPLKYSSTDIVIKVKFTSTKCIKSIYSLYAYVSELDKDKLMYLPYIKFNDYIELICGIWNVQC